MKEKDKVLIIRAFWGIDSEHIGKIGTLEVVPSTSKLGTVITDIDNRHINIDEDGCVPVSSLVRELF